MRASNVDQFLRMLKPDDGSYGFRSLSNSDVEKLLKFYNDQKHLMKDLKLDEARKIFWEQLYERDRSDLYGEDLIQSKVLEVPELLKGKSLKEIREKLEKHKKYSYKFRVSF